MRIFVAMTPAQRSVARLGELVVAYRAKVSGLSMRWIPSPNWHLTLGFLGNIDADRVPDVAEIVDSARDGKGPISLRTRSIGGFPRRKPRVMACALDPTARLERMVKTIRQDLDGAGLGADAKPFRAHVTLGRLSKAHAPVLTSEIGDARIRFDRVAVFRSETLSSGARYQALHSYELVKD